MTDELKQEMTEKFNSAYGEEVKIGLREALCKVYIDGCEHVYQYAIEHSDDVIRLIVRIAKKDIAFTKEEAVKFYHEEMEDRL